MKGRRFWSGLTAFALACTLGWTQARVEWLLPTLQPYSLAVNDTGTHCAVTMGYGALGWMNLTTGAIERLFIEPRRIERADVWGDLLAYVVGDQITLRQLSTGAVIRRWQARGGVNDLRFSPDGQLIGAACRDFRVRIWRVSDGALRFTLNHAYSPIRLAFSMNGQWMATADDFGRVLLWNRATGALIGGRRYHSVPVMGVAFSPDNRWLVSASRYPETGLNLVDLVGNAQAWIYSAGDDPTSVEFAPDSTQMFIGTTQGRIGRWTTAGAPLSPLVAHTYVHALDRAGTRLVSGSYLFRLSVDPFAEPVRSYPGAVQVWDTNTGALLATHYGSTIRPMSLAVLPDGTRIAVGDRYGKIRWYNANTGALMGEWQAHSIAIGSLAVSPDGTRLVSGADDGTVRVWDTATNALIHDLQVPGETGRMSRVVVSRNGAYFAALSYRNGQVPVWDMQTGALVNTLNFGDRERGAPMDLDFTPDSTGIAAAGTGNTLKIADIVSGEIVQEIELEGEDSFAVRYSPDGQYLAVGTYSGFAGVYLWDVQAGAFVKRLIGLGFDEVAFTPDGQAIIARDPYTVRYWRWREMPDESNIDEHTSTLLQISEFAERAQMGVSPDGRRFYMAYESQGIGAWRLPIRADVNGDGCVDDADLLTVLFNFGATGQNAADVNRDGTVDDADLLEVLFNFGQGC